MPAATGQTTGRSVSCGNTARGKSDTCARLADTTAVAATTEPDDRSMPPVMMTRLTPTAMMPITAICSTMICSRSALSKKLWPTVSQPAASKNSAMPSSTRKMLSSGGRLARCNGPVPGPGGEGACEIDGVLLILPVSAWGPRLSGKPVP